jgi:hypothetical protein
MTDADLPATETDRDLVFELENAEERFESGANWFFWIAGLSVVNSLIGMFGGDWAFVIGLGTTQIVDGLAAAYIETLEGDTVAQATQTIRILVIAFNISIALIVVLFGWLARLKHRSIYLLGIVLYAVDGLLFLLALDLWSIAFHILALVFMIRGLVALFKVKSLQREIAAQAPPVRLDQARPFAMPHT